MCLGGSLVERPFTVEGMDKDLGAAQSNAACAIDKFQESGLDVIFESLNPKDFSIPLDNPHLYFFGVHKEQYMKQVGSDPPTGWKEEVRHLIRLIKENLNMNSFCRISFWTKRTPSFKRCWITIANRL